MLSRQLGWGPEVVDEPVDPTAVEEGATFPPDGKWEAMAAWLTEHLRDGDRFRDDERAIWFTEYKDTLDYLNARLAAIGIGAPAARTLFGGSSFAERADVGRRSTTPATRFACSSPPTSRPRVSTSRRRAATSCTTRCPGTR